MHKVLLVTYLFPPSGGVGVPRALGYARYLPQYGAEVVVLTPRRPATAYHDPGLQKLIPHEAIIYRVFNPEIPYRWKDAIWRLLAARGSMQPRENSTSSSQNGSALNLAIRRGVRRVFFPDIQSVWVPFAIHAGRRIIREHGIDTVLVNAPPYSLLKVGLALKKEHPNVKLVTDFRDDWLGYYAVQADGPSDYSVDWSERDWHRARALEKAAVKHSNYISIATPSWQQQLRERYPDENRAKFICTTNGYEPTLFQDCRSVRPKGYPKVVISYFGTLNSSRVYSPKTYLEAIDSLPSDVRAKIETRFIGRVTPDCQPQLAGRADVREFGFLPKEKGIEILRDSDYLLLIATNPSSHAGKLFEYLAMAKPIIALCAPTGEISRVLRETRSGWAVDPWDKTAIAQLLLKCCQCTQRNELGVNPDWQAIRRYSWPEIVRNFAHNIGVLSTQTEECSREELKITV
jgi:glycosyltransferase involved in cell wall biosynthesis